MVEEIRIPPRHRPINPANAESLIKSVWFERVESERPDKFVVLLDTDGSRPEDVLDAIRTNLPARLGDINASIQFAYAERHLEAWYFADGNGLRQYLGRDLGNVDPSRPDAMPNPKLHLRHLLGSRLYTSLVSKEIASKLSVTTIAERSPSFRGFVAAVQNGVRHDD